MFPKSDPRYTRLQTQLENDPRAFVHWFYPGEIGWWPISFHDGICIAELGYFDGNSWKYVEPATADVGEGYEFRPYDGEQELRYPDWFFQYWKHPEYQWIFQPRYLVADPLAGLPDDETISPKFIAFCGIILVAVVWMCFSYMENFR